jgi:FkbM family methyltransferase
MLPRLKWQLAWGGAISRVYAAQVRVGDLKRSLYLRPQDIFVIREIFWQNPYMLPQMKEDWPRCIVDLGAHIGLATLRFKAEFPEARIHCYEPDPDNFQLLELNTEGLEGVVLHQEAVGGVSGEAILHVLPHRHTASSLNRPRHEETAIQIGCVVRSLDQVLTEIGGVDIIKFDIEGAEYEVFLRSRLVHDVRHIVGEMKTDPEDLKRFLALFSGREVQVRSTSDCRMHLVYLGRKPGR